MRDTLQAHKIVGVFTLDGASMGYTDCTLTYDKSDPLIVGLDVRGFYHLEFGRDVLIDHISRGGVTKLTGCALGMLDDHFALSLKVGKTLFYITMKTKGIEDFLNSTLEVCGRGLEVYELEPSLFMDER